MSMVRPFYPSVLREHPGKDEWWPIRDLPLLKDDAVFILRRFSELRPIDPIGVLKRYAMHWRCASELELRSGASRDNAGRYAANSWLRDLSREDVGKPFSEETAA